MERGRRTCARPPWAALLATAWLGAACTAGVTAAGTGATNAAGSDATSDATVVDAPTEASTRADSAADALGGSGGDGALDAPDAPDAPACNDLWAPAVSYPSGPVSPTAVTVADMDGDGKLDLAVGGFGVTPQAPSQATILVGDGAGGFIAKPHHGVLCGDGANRLAVGDFNGDGTPDLVTGNSNYMTAPGCVALFTGNGDGTMDAGTVVEPGWPKNLYRTPLGVAAGDFNADGKLDLAFAYYISTRVANLLVQLGAGDGTFGRATLFPGVAYWVTVGDFNKDGRLDVAIASNVAIRVRLGNGDGTFGTATGYPLAVGEGRVATDDVDGDGVLDLVAFNPGLELLLGRGDGTFQLSRAIASEPVTDVVAGDFTGDARADLAVATGSEIQLLAGNGDGTFQGASRDSLGATIHALAASDFNGDGRLDLAVAGPGVTVLLNAGCHP